MGEINAHNSLMTYPMDPKKIIFRISLMILHEISVTAKKLMRCFKYKHFKIIIHISFTCTRAPNKPPQSLKFKIHGVIFNPGLSRLDGHIIRIRIPRLKELSSAGSDPEDGGQHGAVPGPSGHPRPRVRGGREGAEAEAGAAAAAGEEGGHRHQHQAAGAGILRGSGRGRGG